MACIFHFIYGMSSQPHWRTHIFRGVWIPPTRIYYHILIILCVYIYMYNLMVVNVIPKPLVSCHVPSAWWMVINGDSYSHSVQIPKTRMDDHTQSTIVDQYVYNIYMCMCVYDYIYMNIYIYKIIYIICVYYIYNIYMYIIYKYVSIITYPPV